jgi:hypothetical protein
MCQPAGTLAQRMWWPLGWLVSELCITGEFDQRQVITLRTASAKSDETITNGLEHLLWGTVLCQVDFQTWLAKHLPRGSTGLDDAIGVGVDAFSWHEIKHFDTALQTGIVHHTKG